MEDLPHPRYEDNPNVKFRYPNLFVSPSALRIWGFFCT
jgi:hypothetical protein